MLRGLLGTVELGGELPRAPGCQRLTPLPCPPPAVTGVSATGSWVLHLLSDRPPLWLLAWAWCLGTSVCCGSKFLVLT